MLSTFLICNALISGLALVLLRYRQMTITAKLFIVSVAISCWLVPYPLLTHYLPMELAIDSRWILPLSDYAPNTSKPHEVNNNFLTFSNLFWAACYLGIALFIGRCYQHYQWIKRNRNHSDFKQAENYLGYSVYLSPLVDNALLVGYFKPQIWLNTQLYQSDFQDVVLAHEVTHIKYHDNFWISLLTLIKSIYWWNPLLGRLVGIGYQLLENRCDHNASKLFTENIYQQKLAQLIVNRTPVFNTGLASAVISKNSNINRLKILKETQTMNIFSKLLTVTWFTICIGLVNFSVMSIGTLSANSLPNAPTSEGVKLSFVDIAVAPLAQIVAQFYELEADVEPQLAHQLVTVELISVPEDQVLQVLQQQTNIQFSIDPKNRS